MSLKEEINHELMRKAFEISSQCEVHVEEGEYNTLYYTISIKAGSSLKFLQILLKLATFFQISEFFR